MIQDVNSINWINTNIIEKDIKEWVGSGATPDSNGITISSGGYIEEVIIKQGEDGSAGSEEDDGLTDIVSASKYIKIGLDIIGDIEDISDYTNDIDVIINEKYLSDDTDFNRSRMRILSVTKANSVYMDGYYHLVYLMDMLGKPLKELKVKIVNNSGSSKTFRWIGAYASQDIGTYQYSQIQQDSITRYGTYIEVRADDPINPEVGRIWLVVDGNV